MFCFVLFFHYIELKKKFFKTFVLHKLLKTDVTFKNKRFLKVIKIRLDIQ